MAHDVDPETGRATFADWRTRGSVGARCAAMHAEALAAVAWDAVDALRRVRQIDRIHDGGLLRAVSEAGRTGRDAAVNRWLLRYRERLKQSMAESGTL